MRSVCVSQPFFKGSLLTSWCPPPIVASTEKSFSKDKPEKLENPKLDEWRTCLTLESLNLQGTRSLQMHWRLKPMDGWGGGLGAEFEKVVRQPLRGEEGWRHELCMESQECSL